MILNNPPLTDFETAVEFRAHSLCWLRVPESLGRLRRAQPGLPTRLALLKGLSLLLLLVAGSLAATTSPALSDGLLQDSESPYPVKA